MITEIEFEKQVKSFLRLRDKWYALVEKIKIHSSHSQFDEEFRPIGMTSDITLIKEARAIINKWEAFKEVADEYCARTGRTVQSILYYQQVPSIISGFVGFTVNEFEAASIKQASREKILGFIDKKYRNNPNPIDRENMQNDIERFSKFPEGTMFRLRACGYRDTMIYLYNKGSYRGRYDSIRVTRSGCILDTRDMPDPSYFRIRNKIEGKGPYFYDELVTIPCSIYPNFEIYLQDDVDRIKQLRTETKSAAESAKEEKRQARTATMAKRRKASRTKNPNAVSV